MYQNIYNCICQNTKKIRFIIHYVKSTAKLFFFKFDFQKVDQYAGGKWLIHDTKCRKDNQLQLGTQYKSIDIVSSPCPELFTGFTICHFGEHPNLVSLDNRA